MRTQFFAVATFYTSNGQLTTTVSTFARDKFEAWDDLERMNPEAEISKVTEAGE